MTVLATKGNTKFRVSDIETRIEGVTYTAVVISEVKKEVKGDLFLIIGSDQYLEIETWHKPERIFADAKVVVVPRPNYPISDDFPYRDEIILTKGPSLDISSTTIRERIKTGKSVRYLVPGKVIEYINKKRLYR